MAPIARTKELNRPVHLAPTVGGPFGNRERVDAITMTTKRDELSFQRVMRRSPGFFVTDDITLNEARRIAEEGGGFRRP